jgi:hypothetical protein
MSAALSTDNTTARPATSTSQRTSPQDAVRCLPVETLKCRRRRFSAAEHSGPAHHAAEQNASATDMSEHHRKQTHGCRDTAADVAASPCLQTAAHGRAARASAPATNCRSAADRKSVAQIDPTMELRNSWKTDLITTTEVHVRQAARIRHRQYTAKTREIHARFSIVRARVAIKSRPDKPELRYASQQTIVQSRSARADCHCSIVQITSRACCPL